MRRADAELCRALLDSRAAAFALSPSFQTLEAFEHRFLGTGAHSFVLRGGDGAPLGFISFSLLPLRAASGARVVQAQLLGYATTTSTVVDDDLLAELLSGALREAKRLGVHVFNANRQAELTPRLLESLGFRQGDASSFICLDGGGSGGGRVAAEEVAWWPVL